MQYPIDSISISSSSTSGKSRANSAGDGGGAFGSSASASASRIPASSGGGGYGAGNLYAQTEALRQRNHDVGLSERSAGVPTPVRTIESDPDILRCRSNELYGLQMVQVGVTGGGNVAIGDVVVHTQDNARPYVGTPMLAERAHPYAGGSSSVTEFGKGSPPPKLTVTGGGCSGPSNVKVEPRGQYRILIQYDDYNTDPPTEGVTTVGEVVGTLAEANSQMTALVSVPPWDNSDGEIEGGTDKIYYRIYYLETM
jgi:hypothetical protein